jgi:hypothetical protein
MMAKDYSYKDAMESALGAGMMGGLGGMGGGMGGAALRSAARGMAEEAAMERGKQEKGSMLDRLGREAMETARSYGKLYKEGLGMKKGGKVKGYKAGGTVSSASKRADGIAQRGKTKGRIV